MYSHRFESVRCATEKGVMGTGERILSRWGCHAPRAARLASGADDVRRAMLAGVHLSVADSLRSHPCLKEG